MGTQKICWSQYKGKPLAEAPFYIQKLVGSIVVRLDFSELTREEYFFKRTTGFRFCWYCIPHWQEENKFGKSGSTHCKIHYKLSIMDYFAESIAKKIGADRITAVRNVASKVGVCLVCGEKFKKKENSNIQFCIIHGKLSSEKQKWTKYYTTQSKQIKNCPSDYVARRLAGERFCNKCEKFWKPKTKKAIVCSNCKPLETRSLSSCIIKWRIFAQNNNLNVETHIANQTAGLMVCRKCFHYNSLEDHKKKCKGCGKNPRCAWATMKEGGVRRV